MSHAKASSLSKFTRCAGLAGGLGRFLGMIHCGCAVGHGCAGAEETLKTEVGVPCFGGCGVGTARSFFIFCDFDASAEKDPLTHINEGLQFRDMFSLPCAALEPRPMEAHRFREFRHMSV